MKEFSKYVGLDVHQETIAVSVAERGGEVRYVGEISNTPEAMAKLVNKPLPTVVSRLFFICKELIC